MTSPATIIALVAREEWRALLRNRVALVAAILAVALTCAAILSGLGHRHAIESERARFQTIADDQWHGQPDRHPHRVVHYGHYVFRPLSPLAFFDFGVDPFVGHTLYLEGHRQNTANFSDATQSSVLMRFGLLSPAFLLQTLVPLLLVFLAFTSIAREREQGQLRFLLAQGIRGTHLLAGKLVGHAAVALLLATPAFISLALIGIFHDLAALPAVLMALGYGLYLLLWSALAVLISSLAPRARDALLALVAIWIVLVVVVPRTLPDIALARHTLPTRIETDVAIHRELARIGDSHNPNDPYFQAFREQTLAKYGVATVEELPVNYGGLLMQEGERLTSELFDRHMREDFERQAAQSRFIGWFSALSPVIALRTMSAALAQSDRHSYAQFLLEAEKYRFALIQALNQLHAEKIRYKNDRDQRVSQAHWQEMPRFSYQPPALGETMRRAVLPALAAIACWVLLLTLAFHLLAKRLERTGQ